MAVFDVIDAASAKLFYWLSKWRGKRFFHPTGTVYKGTLTIKPDGPLPSCTLFNAPTTFSVIVRLSRGIGLPSVLPDILGFAMRISDLYGPGLHQDILMLTCGGGRFTRHMPLFKLHASSSFFSTILSYTVGGEKCLLGILPSMKSSEEHPAFTLAIASPMKEWQTVGEIRLGEVLPNKKIRYNPWNTGGGIRPLGSIHRLRKNTYVASQRGRANKS